MRLLLFAFLAPPLVVANRFIAGCIPDLTVCLIVCAIFSLLVCSVVAALILGSSSNRPKDNRYVGVDMASGDDRTAHALCHVRHGRIFVLRVSASGHRRHQP